ncbi:acyltransferase [Methylobacterium sp. J-030]|uniref:acyltransferase family protein n=1 Tax=Methylobacterium sp. J-030 TaxID=2836627 RepID=UPI001FBA115F|nr:acyltransferase [Methylobacterium sp. J-030]MCJ2068601.1 acyltransferase [Methylobacterium sp. J-030]
MTISEAMRTNKGLGPGFHFLRHALALIILIFHCRYMVTFGSDGGATALVTSNGGGYVPRNFDLATLREPFTYALVGGFFALSGFLVTGSAFRNPDIRIFFANRLLRIIPALSVEVTLSALVLGPIVTNLPLASYFSDPQVLRYFGNILGFVTYTLPGVYVDNPWSGIVNGNLWTLPPEFWCYAIMLVALTIGMKISPRLFLIGTALTISIWTIVDTYDQTLFPIRFDRTHFVSPFIVLLFCVGACFYIIGDKIVLSFPRFLAAGIIYYAMIQIRILSPLCAIPLAYCTLYVGFRSFEWFDKIVTSDLSYGIYLYGWPISQAVVHFVLPSLLNEPILVRLLIIESLSVLSTVIFAALSWKFIEKPFLKLKKYFNARRTVIKSDLVLIDSRKSVGPGT